MLASLLRTNLLAYIAEDLGSFWDTPISCTGSFKEDCEIELVNLLRSLRLGQEPQQWLAQDTIDTAAILEDLNS
jgi:hypothetical protein